MATLNKNVKFNAYDTVNLPDITQRTLKSCTVHNLHVSAEHFGFGCG